MRFLVISAHPDKASYCACLRDTVIDSLSKSGNLVDSLNLYEERFDPVMPLEEWRAYTSETAVSSDVRSHVDRLQRAQGLVFVFPTWYYGMPAVLKGYLDRIWLPGVAFRIDEGRPKPMLDHIARFGVVTTYGASRLINQILIGDPNKRVFMRGLSRLTSKSVRKLWLAQYGLDYITDEARGRFVSKVAASMLRFGSKD